MKILIQIKAVLIGLLLLVFVLFPTALIALPFRLERRLKIISPIWSFCARILLRYGTHSYISIKKDLRSDPYRTTPAFGLFIANHQSFVDIPLILCTLQVPPIMKKEILYIPIFGWIGWISGALPVSRSKFNSRRRVFEQTRKRILQDKIGVQVYPEGTRSKDAHPKSMKEIKKPLLVFAYNENIPVIPVSLYGTRGVLNQFGIINPKRHVGIIVEKELHPKDFKTANEFIEAAWGKVIQGHQEMKLALAPLNGN